MTALQIIHENWMAEREADPFHEDNFIDDEYMDLSAVDERRARGYIASRQVGLIESADSVILALVKVDFADAQDGTVQATLDELNRRLPMVPSYHVTVYRHPIEMLDHHQFQYSISPGNPVASERGPANQFDCWLGRKDYMAWLKSLHG